MGRGLSDASKELIERIMDVFKTEHPNSPRRVAYAIFGNRAGMNAPKISQLCRRLLESGRLPLDWYDDSSRAYVDASVAEDIDDLLDMNAFCPPFDPWKSQPVRVVVWSEKSIAGTLGPTLQHYSVPFLNTSGWNSTKMMMEEARRTHRDRRRLVILYCGDHDAAGLRMSEADIPDRLDRYGARNWRLHRVAITAQDFATMRRKRLTDPIKPSDPNAEWYALHTGYNVGVELETLSAPDLRHRMEAAIELCIDDFEAWHRVSAASTAVQESWEAHVAAWPRPHVDVPALDPDKDE
jgi:hypothetical protein